MNGLYSIELKNVSDPITAKGLYPTDLRKSDIAK